MIVFYLFINNSLWDQNIFNIDYSEKQINVKCIEAQNGIFFSCIYDITMCMKSNPTTVSSFYNVHMQKPPQNHHLQSAGNLNLKTSEVLLWIKILMLVSL